MTGAPRAVPVVPLLAAGLVLGVLGDVLLRLSDAPGLNFSLCVAAVALAAIALHRTAGGEPARGRVAWLAIGVLFAGGLAWRDAPPLKLLALGAATVAFALAAYRPRAAWVRRAGVVDYAVAWATGALHAWVAAGLVLVDAARSTQQPNGRSAGWRRAAGVARGLVIATPLLVVFGALLMSADAVFRDMVLRVVRIDVELIASHVLLFSLCAWLATGYLRGFLAGTEPPVRAIWQNGVLRVLQRRPALSITEVATALATVDLLFLLFVIVQFRYLFGGDALVQVTPDLTYAEYARRGFFELVIVALLVVPLLLGAEWLVDRRSRRDDLLFTGLAGLQIVLVLLIGASAFQRLRLYHASYGLTDTRLYAMVLLIWIGAILIWLAATVLRGRRELFGFGALATGLVTVALLFALNPDAIVARTNVARVGAPHGLARFDVAYAMSLSGDAVPVLVDAMPALPREVQCPLARQLLRRWGSDRGRSFRGWSWAASRASAAVREHEPRLASMVRPDHECAPPPGR